MVRKLAKAITSWLPSLTIKDEAETNNLTNGLEDVNELILWGEVSDRLG